ncbi:MAG: MarR family winged helix-turn-helix transcriptional regulator, partial [Rhodothalassiaceae bacterium]
GISQSQLARAVQVERATLGQTIEDLVKRELVERRRNPADRRAYALHLSASGQAFLARLLPAIRAHETAISSRLTARESAEFRRLLGKFLGYDSDRE